MNAAEVMTRNIVPIRGDMPVSEAIRLMLDNHSAVCRDGVVDLHEVITE
jgi:CBS domain-containing protein